MSPDPVTPQPPAAEIPIARPAAIPVARPARPRPGLGMAVVWCLVFLLTTQVPAGFVAVGYVFVAVPADERPTDPRAFIASDAAQTGMAIGMGLAQILGIACGLILLRCFAGREWARRIDIRMPHARHVVLVCAAAPALMVLADLAQGFFQTVLPSLKDFGEFGIDDFVTGVAHWAWWVGVLVIGVGPGLSEELFCRGFLGRGLVGRYGVVPGVLLTSLLFGMLHVEPPQAAMAAMMGVALHLAYLSGRSFWLPVLMHVLNNSASVLTVADNGPRLAPLHAIDAARQARPEALAFAAASVLTAVAFAMWRSRVVAKPASESDSRPVTLVSRSPGMLAWLLVALSFGLFVFVVAVSAG
jgi:membrane protease YdiL (CAAX protease family)